MEHFEIRQQVQTVQKKWLETIHTGMSHRAMECTFLDLVAANPDEYFEFIRIVKNEECLGFTKNLTPNAALSGWPGKDETETEK